MFARSERVKNEQMLVVHDLDATISRPRRRFMPHPYTNHQILPASTQPPQNRVRQLLDGSFHMSYAA